jgi:uncharacterized protein YjiS (DUF1127 family)
MDRTSTLPRVEHRTRKRSFTDFVEAVILWIERQRERQALLRLDDRMLRDIGLTRVDVEREADKPFWRP